MGCDGMWDAMECHHGHGMALYECCMPWRSTMQAQSIAARVCGCGSGLAKGGLRERRLGGTRYGRLSFLFCPFCLFCLFCLFFSSRLFCAANLSCVSFWCLA